MFRIENENDLRDAFRNLDRDAVEIPADFRFPIYVRDYLAWRESSGARVFLVFAEPEQRKTFGIAFRADQSRGVAPHHCEWCHSTGGSSEIGLLTANASDRKRVGLHLCLDLTCLGKLESRANLSGENSRVIARRLTANMMDFARRTLF
ncbi:MAG: FBP domain-containing protein [Bdellovibrionales bacterium]|nr:FBP domain-containing protein [Bdellovibrionales bacterium]